MIIFALIVGIVEAIIVCLFLALLIWAFYESSDKKKKTFLRRLFTEELEEELKKRKLNESRNESNSGRRDNL